MMTRILLVISLFACTTLVMVAQDRVSGEQAMKYALTEREGPWLIHIGSFRGDESYAFAIKFAEETRAKYRYQTYIYSMNERDALRDREEIRQQRLSMIGSETIAGTREKQKIGTIRIVKEYSVFVGSFADMLKAREEAARIKALPAPESIPSAGVHLYKEPTSRAADDPEAGKYGIFSGIRSEEGKRINQSIANPYRQAFVVQNPVRYREQAAAKVVQKKAIPFDPSWTELNGNEKYSIFSCPKNWTLVVATFVPPSEIMPMQNSVMQIGMQNTKNLGKGIEVAADNARKFAELLRDGGRGYDAYVFHTRLYSIVTVGAFDTRKDENMEKAWIILRDFAATQNEGPFSLLMKMPQPMQVPGR